MSQGCPKCSADNSAEAKFCRQCGTALHPEELGNVIEANTIILRDKAGMPRAVLTASNTENMVALGLIDEQGTERITLAIQEDSAGLELMDKKGCPRISVKVGETGQFGGLPMFTIYDEEHRPRCQLMHMQDFSASLSFKDERGHSTSGLSGKFGLTIEDDEWSYTVLASGPEKKEKRSQ